MRQTQHSLLVLAGSKTRKDAVDSVKDRDNLRGNVSSRFDAHSQLDESVTERDYGSIAKPGFPPSPGRTEQSSYCLEPLAETRYSLYR